MRYPSIKTICSIEWIDKVKTGFFNTPQSIAREARRIMKNTDSGSVAMEQLDKLFNTCGVEFVGRGKNNKSPAFLYLNTGHTYATTILFINGQFRVGNWGYIVERGRYD